MKFRNVCLAGVLGSCLAVSAIAEAPYELLVSTIESQTLYEQTIERSGLVTIKPGHFDVQEGIVDAVAQCLWSVQVDLTSGEAVFSPGKMICVGPKQEVLEAVPVGEFEAFGRCNADCTRFTVAANVAVRMNLSEPLLLTLQPRAVAN